jgi:hypothetical protein
VQQCLGEPAIWPLKLDVGRNHYYDHSIEGCLDIADSIFLDPPAPDAVLPPLWPRALLTPRDCALEGSIRSPSEEEGAETVIQFFNVRYEGVHVFRLDGEGQRRMAGGAFPLPAFPRQYETRVGQAWLVADPEGNCLGIYVAEAPASKVIVTRSP